MPTVTPNKYAIELRDSAFRLKQRLEHLAVNVSWEWNRVGGCGRCTFEVPGDYLRFTIDADDDIRIYLPDAGGTTATLWYRGYVETWTPLLSGGSKGTIRVECMGYFGWMDRVVAHDSGGQKVYSSSEISLTVTDLINTFIVPNSDIALGTVDASDFVADTLEFKSSVKEALRTCFDLAGGVEYGVDASLNFYWRNPVYTASKKYYVGDRIANLSEKVDFKGLANYIFLEGGDNGDGVTFTAYGLAQDSINRFGRREDIVSNGAIVTGSVANKYISNLLRQKAIPQRQLTVSLKNIADRFEASLPIGAVSIVDHDATQTAAKYGTTGHSGSNKYYGTALNSGSGQLYGGQRRDQVERIIYSMSPEDGRVHADLTLGVSIGFSRASAEMKRIENTLNSARQRQL